MYIIKAVAVKIFFGENLPQTTIKKRPVKAGLQICVKFYDIEGWLLIDE